MNRTTTATVLGLGVAVCTMVLLQGCGGSVFTPLTGGGLPPGEVDIGGIIVTEDAQAADVTTLQGAETPVVGAWVRLMRGTREMAMVQTGNTGHFRFENPETGTYRVEVTPPAGSGLQGAERQFQHQAGRQTFLRIVLEPEQ